MKVIVAKLRAKAKLMFLRSGLMDVIGANNIVDSVTTAMGIIEQPELFQQFSTYEDVGASTQ